MQFQPALKKTFYLTPSSLHSLTIKALQKKYFCLSHFHFLTLSSQYQNWKANKYFTSAENKLKPPELKFPINPFLKGNPETGYI